ncbi:MAG: protein O-GlcNAcase [Leifsonia sp.]
MTGAAFHRGGVIEGFYGRPWTHAQRLDMIRFLADVGLGVFVYSPKDDPFTRRKWRELYPPAERAALAELVAEANSLGVSVSFALSPGLSMRYSDAGDIDAILAKFASVAELGVTSFALFLDDIPEALRHAPDQAAFGSLVEAQIAVVNEVASRLSEAVTVNDFAVCPTLYRGRGNEPYIAELGRGLNAGIRLYWTGRAICSPELETRDAKVFFESTGRRPLYWDNFPVNDVAMTGELHIGPYLGRDADLPDHAEGIVANAMPLAESSKIALSSIADYLRDPVAFDAEASWESALARIAGKRDAEAFREFADACRGSALCTDDAPRLAAEIDRFAFDFEYGNRPDAVAGLGAYVEGLLERTAVLTEAENVALGREIAPWLAHYRNGLAAVLRVIALLPKDGMGTPPALEPADKPAVLADLMELRSARLRVFGDLVDMFLSDLGGEFD